MDRNEDKISTIVDWILTEKCNLNCYYCLQHADTRKAKCESVESGFVRKAKSTMLFHLTGGEPFLVPNLIELVNELQSMGHYVSMNTNLTYNAQKFAEQVNKEKLLFVNASYHYVYRKKHVSPFIKNYMCMRKVGIFTYATIVMIPQLFDELSFVANDLISHGVCVLPKLMRGRDNGKQYPQGYNSEQLVCMSNLLHKSKSILSNEDSVKLSRACLYNVSIDDWQSESRSVGTRCFDGLRYIRITETGDVVFCNNISIGNVYQDDFQFHFNDMKKDCPYKIDNYLCKKNY